MLLLQSCSLFQKKKDPDPLENAAGIYVGTMQDNTTLIQNVRANVTTTENGGRLYVSSVGITSSNYQLVLNNNSSTNGVIGNRNGFSYSGQAIVNGQSLNITGSYRLNSTTFANFSFTGVKQ